MCGLRHSHQRKQTMPTPINSGKAKTQNEIYYAIVGIILGLLIINDLCHIITGEGLWYHF